MKKFLCIVLSLAAVGSLVGSASAQQQAAAAQGGVMLIDLPHIFENYQGFTAMKADLTTAINVAEKEIADRREAVKKKLLDLKTAAKGGPEHTLIQEEITKLQIEINTRVAGGRKEFADQEVKIIYHVYKLVQDELATLCRQHGYRLALQFNRKPLSDAEYTHVLQKMQNAVVHAEPGLDVTDYVLQQLNARYAQRHPGAGQSAPRR